MVSQTGEIPPRSAELALVVKLIGRDRLVDAGKRLDALLAHHPSDSEVLRLAAIVESRAENHETAVRLAEQGLSGDLAPATYRRNLDGFLEVAGAASDQATGDRVLDRGVPLDDAGEALAPDDIEVLLSLANRLVTWRRTEEGLALVDTFAAQFQQSAKGLSTSGVLKARGKRYDEALVDLAAASRLEPLSPLALVAGRTAARATEDVALARTTSAEILNRFPAYLTKLQPRQRALIGVANILGSAGARDSRNLDLASFYFRENFITQLFDKYSSEYRLLSIFVNSPNAIAAIRQLPSPDIVFNGILNAEIIRRFNLEDKITRAINSWDKPVINDVSCVVRSTRLDSSNLYSDIANLIVPKIAIFDKKMPKEEFIEQIEAKFSYPVIVRGLFEQQGQNMYLVQNRAELEEAFVLVRARSHFYVIQFIENKHEGGFYKKIRAAVAGDTIQIVRVDSDINWNVHGRKSEERVLFYQNNPELLEEEAAICSDPVRHLGGQVMNTLADVRRRMPLDVFGIDFDVTADGRLLFFEANGAMNLLSSADPRVPNPKEAERVFFDAFRDLVRRKMDGEESQRQ